MAVYKHNLHPNAFVAFFRKIYNPVGFNKGYNFILFFIFAGALFGFALARAPYMNVNGYFMSRAAPGEAYWYRQSYYNIGIRIHLLCVIPASLLVVWQFVPVIRHKARLFHRINGYVVVLLLIIGNIGAVMIARRAFGGTIATQSAVGAFAIFTTVGSFLAWINIKRLQIEQHRAWMLRTWAIAGGIITVRLVQVMMGLIISRIGSYYITMLCAQIEGAGGNFDKYPSCQADPEGFAVVHANWSGTTNGVEEVAATFHLSFGATMWLTFALHLLGVELYLRLTKAETERLRQVSYERQLERGLRHPGSAGLTSDKFGDEEEWRPRGKIQPSQAAEAERKVEGHEVLSDGSSDLSKPSSVLGWDRQ
ncbi:hypothetical protein CERZMDRAFT_32106 [Cercospora zeae-maydis SCOH1-5]|uniref:DUF2306 domain-containing protein n=1 Tax=Cercospora zeae-maydis SCOH1-5 TaxID=717836 RepID=A0A6A6FU65_9PEZI|nr:hypothetical protein CERZMDRAFT_32106 [Cercospora zeae-maydis SCOH1-5]